MEITARTITYESGISASEQFAKIGNALSEFGLTQNQSRVFCALGKLGPKSASEIGKLLQIPRTETYHVLSALQKRGIVSTTFDHPIKFSALPIEKAIAVLLNAENERLNQMQNQVSVIEKLWKETPDAKNEFGGDIEERFQVLHGQNQIYSIIQDMINSAQDEILLVGCEQDFAKFYHADIFECLKDGNAGYKVLTSVSEKAQYFLSSLDKTKIKKLGSDVENKLCFIIKDQKEVLFYIKNAAHVNKETVAIWSDSDSIVYSKLLLFGSLWSKGITLGKTR